MAEIRQDKVLKQVDDFAVFKSNYLVQRRRAKHFSSVYVKLALEMLGADSYQACLLFVKLCTNQANVSNIIVYVLRLAPTFLTLFFASEYELPINK